MANEVSESAANGSVVGVTALATDGDATDTITYSLDDDAGGRFAINASTRCGDRGQQHAAWTTRPPPATTSPCGATSSDTSTNTAGFTINLTDDNTEFSISAVSDSDAAANRSRRIRGQRYGRGRDRPGYRWRCHRHDHLLAGRRCRWAVRHQRLHGVVTVANNTLLDYETTTSHNITVRATSSDTSTNTAGFTVSLTDDNTEFAISAVSDSDAVANEVGESAANGSVVGVTALATDGDVTDTITYSLDDDAGGRFAINASTGVVTVANNTLLDYETTTSHNITVRATSTDTSTNTAGFTINLTDDNTEFSISAVSDSDAAANEVGESAANGSVVGVTALATDGDATDTITYTLDDDAGGRFAINASTGVVTVANNTLLDYETTTSHNITVRATSSDTSTNTAGFTINLTDDNTEFLDQRA